MRDSGTPLTALSLGVSYHQKGWFIDLNCNYYDRIYLSYSPNYRFHKNVVNRNDVMKAFGQPIINDVTGEIVSGALDQAKVTVASCSTAQSVAVYTSSTDRSQSTSWFRTSSTTATSLQAVTSRAEAATHRA